MAYSMVGMPSGNRVSLLTDLTLVRCPVYVFKLHEEPSF